MKTVRHQSFLLMSVIYLVVSLFAFQSYGGEYICCFEGGAVQDLSCQSVSFKKNKDLVRKFDRQHEAADYCKEQGYTHMRKYQRMPGKRIISLLGLGDHDQGKNCHPQNAVHGAFDSVDRENKGEEFFTYRWEKKSSKFSSRSHQQETGVHKKLGMLHVNSDELRGFLGTEKNCISIGDEFENYLGRIHELGEQWRLSLSKESGRIKAAAIYQIEGCQAEINVICANHGGGQLLKEIIRNTNEEQKKFPCENMKYSLESVPRSVGFYLKMGFSCHVKNKKTKKIVTISRADFSAEDDLRHLDDHYTIPIATGCFREDRL